MMIHATKIQRCFEYAKLLGKKGEQHPLRMLLLAVLFKIALHYETSMALVTFCFGSAFGMVTFRMRLMMMGLKSGFAEMQPILATSVANLARIAELLLFLRKRVLSVLPYYFIGRQ